MPLPSLFANVDVRSAGLSPQLSAYAAGVLFALAASPCSTPGNEVFLYVQVWCETDWDLGWLLQIGWQPLGCLNLSLSRVLYVVFALTCALLPSSHRTSAGLTAGLCIHTAEPTGWWPATVPVQLWVCGAADGGSNSNGEREGGGGSVGHPSYTHSSIYIAAVCMCSSLYACK